MLATLRERVRGSDIWVAGSRDYRAFEDYLLPAEAGRNLGMGQEIDPSQFIKTRAAILHEQLNVVMRQAARAELDGVEIEDGALYIARMKAAVPEAARDLAIQLNGMLPRIAHHPSFWSLRRGLGRRSGHRRLARLRWPGVCLHRVRRAGGGRLKLGRGSCSGGHRH